MRSSIKTVLISLLLIGSIVSIMPLQISASGEGWLSGWDYRQGITITGSTGAGTNYQVYLNVTHDADMQADFDDLRVTDGDGETELDYWLEDFVASTSADLWVEVTANLNITQVIYLYWGNDGVSTTSSGVDTFIFFDDFENANFDLWDIANPLGWSIVTDRVAMGTYSAFADGNGANPYKRLQWNFTEIDYGIMIHLWNNIEIDSVGYSYIHQNTQSQDNVTTNMRFTEDDVVFAGNPAQTFATGSHSADIWYRTEWGLDFTASEISYYQDRVFDATKDMTDYDGTSVTSIRNFLYAENENGGSEDWWMDDYYVRKWIPNEPVPAWGLWNPVISADFYFPVSWNPAIQFGYDAFFIFLGLIMLPISTMYLVRGGRKEMSTDKLFMGLIIFGLGLGFLIGGILP